MRMTYSDEFYAKCEQIREHISSKDVPSDFVPNAFSYLLHVSD